MAYTYVVHESIEDANSFDWDQVCAEGGADIFMDRRFIAAVEGSMGDTCRFWFVQVYDEGKRPVACACLFRMAIDLANLVSSGLAGLLRRLPSPLRRLRSPGVILCGLPVSAGQTSLAIVPGCDGHEVVSLLESLMAGLRRKESADMIALKEFGDGDIEVMDDLLGAGYKRIETLKMNTFRPAFRDLDDYCAALNTRHRNKVKQSWRKLRDGGGKTSVLTSPDEICAVYDDRAHKLYLDVVAKSEYKLEVLPRSFFLELTRRLPGQVALIVAEKEGRLCGFLWMLDSEDACNWLFIGVDYQVNEALDLYFNLMYAGLDYSLRQGVARIHLGQTAEAFKARLGCAQSPLYLYVKGVTLPFSLVTRFASGSLQPKIPAAPEYNLFAQVRRPSPADPG